MQICGNYNNKNNEEQRNNYNYTYGVGLTPAVFSLRALNTAYI